MLRRGEVSWRARKRYASSNRWRQIPVRPRKAFASNHLSSFAENTPDESAAPDECMTSDHDQLARGLAAGSIAAWHRLYDAYSESVWRCVARRVGPFREDVADIVQETFLAAARSARTFDPARGSLWAWLSGIARRQAALHFRRKQTRPEAGGEVDSHNFARANGDPLDLVGLAETAQAVRAVLGGLPADYETLLVGKYIDGLSLDELAASEELSVEAVSSKLARARRAFREAYERLEKPTRSASEGRTPTRSASEGVPGRPLKVQA
jgi:RNA polymerase sigma-70 factor (ECF subfamily)